MKNFLLFSALLLSASLSAQVSFGVNFLYNQAWQKYDESLNIDRGNVYIDKFGGSATVQYDFSPNFSIVAEPGFIQRGAACFPGFLPSGNEVTFVGNYLEMPVLLKGRIFAAENQFQFFAFAGAGYSYMLSATRTIDFQDEGTPDQRNRINFDEEPNVNRTDFGFYGGGGVGILMGPGYITATARYYHGMPNVDDFQESKNRALGFALGYLISL